MSRRPNNSTHETLVVLAIASLPATLVAAAIIGYVLDWVERNPASLDQAGAAWLQAVVSVAMLGAVVFVHLSDQVSRWRQRKKDARREGRANALLVRDTLSEHASRLTGASELYRWEEQGMTLVGPDGYVFEFATLTSLVRMSKSLRDLIPVSANLADASGAVQKALSVSLQVERAVSEISREVNLGVFAKHPDDLRQSLEALLGEAVSKIKSAALAIDSAIVELDALFDL